MPRGENGLIFVDEVRRDENGKVLSVKITWDYRVTLRFIWRDGKPFEVSRILQRSRWDPEAAFIPKSWYKKILGQVSGIFQSGEPEPEPEPESEPESESKSPMLFDPDSDD
mgnify:CR=1 FL=1